jgi:hypothetical protein
MSYMEQQMQSQMEGAEIQANLIFEQMERFEGFVLSIPDVDETVIIEKQGHFDYANEDVQSMWVCFRKGAGI